MDTAIACDHFPGGRILAIVKLSHGTTALLGLVAAIAAAEPVVDLDAVVARHVEARGGRASIEAIQTYESDIRIVEPAFEVDGVYVATRDGRMRVDILAEGKRVFTEALDRDRAWSWSPDEGVRDGSAAGAMALRHGIELPFKLFGLHEVRDRGHRLEFVGREVVDGKNYHVLRLTLDDGFESLYFLDPATWLIERDRQRRALHVDVDPTPEWIETSYEDYRPVGGVQFPHRQVERQLATGKVLATVTVREVRINPSLDPGRFSPS
jgi:hypothetical protein